MSHFRQYQGDAQAEDGRNLGDEWTDWDGRDGQSTAAGRALFLLFSAIVSAGMGIAALLFVYLVSPRLAMWHASLPAIAWALALLFALVAALWFAFFALTATTGRRLIGSPHRLKPLFDAVFSGTFHAARCFGISRDRMGHSFVRVSNSVSRALKPQARQERLMILLPRCLAKEQLQAINALKERYPLTVHTVSGGELARKKVKELKPTAIIGVACERDLVSGIRDVGNRFSVIGIPNRRPQGPCKETLIDMRELIDAIEFFVGPPTTPAASAGSAAPGPQAQSLLPGNGRADA